MNYFSLPKLLIFSAALLIGYSSFSQAVYIDSSGTTPKYKKVKAPGGRMTDFQGAMDYEFNMIKNPTTGKIPEGSFTQEKEQAIAILANQQKNNISNVGTPYAFQGPNNLGGRTRTITYDVRYNGTSNRIILAGGVSGGVYKSTDDGATWVRKSPTGEHFSCTSIAQDTRVGSQDTWYYSVGESSGNSASFSGATYFGNGVYKSTDNGETWARLTSSNTTALESFSTGADAIQKVIVDPTDGNVYVACLAKIMRSTDGGTTWVDVLPGVLAFSSQTTDIVVSATGRLYASFGGTNDSGVDGVWASPPGATSGDPGSWTRIAGAGAGGSPVGWNFEAPSGTPGGYGRVVLHIPTADATKLYALYWNNVTYTCGAPSPEAELFRWDDVGATWTDLSATLPDEAGCLAGNDPFAVQGGYDLVIASKPDAAGTLFIGGTNAYRSTDAGLTWTRIGGYAGTANYALYTSSHPDIHAFAFQPGSPLIMLCANDGGIQRTTDNTAGTVAWTQINTGYRTYQYYHVTVDPRVGNTKVMGGTQDNGTARNVGGVGTTHESIFGGDGVSVGLSDLIGGIQYEYVGFQFGEIFRRDATLAAGFGTYIIPPGETGTGLFVTLFKLDVDNSEILYYANDNKLYRTTSASTVASGTWTDMTGIATAVGAANDITAIATTRGTYSPATASLFLGASNGKVYRLNDPAGVAAGTGPVDITGGAFSGYVSSIAVNPRNDDTVVVTFSNYGVTSVFWTGTANSAVPTWTAVEGALTLPSYRSSAIAVTTAGVEYFVGTSTGLYTSMGLPGAVAWTKEGATEMGNAVISSLSLRASDNKLLVGTHGYGMWETSLTTGAACTITLTSAAGTNAQTVCIGTPITPITYATTDATGATFSGLPAGVTGVWAANVVTISGTPTAAGVFSYTVTLTGGSCVAVTATGTITVTANNTVTLTSAAGTNAQTVCISTPITPITYATTGATGATFSGLPSGVTGSWAANVATISGTPTTAGVFSYTVTLIGGCGTVTATGSITVTANNTVTLTSAAGTNSQTVAISTPITAITYSTTGATGATVTGLPAGVTGSWAANVVTISGTPTATGVFSYTVTLTGGCGTITATGTITVNPPTLETWELSAAAGSQASSAPTTTAVNITAGILTRGAGVTASAGGGSISSSGWFNSAAATTLADAITNNEYYEFTLPVNAGFTADVTALAFYLRSSATGPNTATLRSSADSYASDLGTASAIPNAAASLYTLPVTLTGISGTLTFRLYGWGGASGGGTPSTGGTMRIGTSPTALADDLDIFGTTAAAGVCSATLTSAPGTNAQTVCISTAITPITYSTVGATGATFTGLPAGVTGSWAANVITISGTPTAAGVFSYTATLTGGPCTVQTATGTITVTANNTVTLTSAAGTNAQTVCISTAITSITYATTGATGATVTGLPAGVTGSWAANVVTISGTPTAAGVFIYTVTLTGGCGTITATGSITVTANNTITLTSAAGTNAQTVAISTPITTITYSTTGATGATVTGLPAGVTGSWAANVVTISGTPTVAGVFSYTVTLTGGCGSITATGSITVTGSCSATLTSAAGTNAQTVCISTAITPITYSTVGATGATFTGLPAGVTGSWAANVITISGTPTAAGVFSYTATLTGGPCTVQTATGTITVTANNTVTLTSAAGTNAQTVCISTAITSITYATTGATGATVTGLPAGVTGSWAANVVTISGTPTAAGVFSYTVTLTGGCGTVTTTGSITVTTNNTVTLTSAAGTNAQTVAISTPITTITYSTTGATGATVTGLPAGVIGVWAANVVTISGTPTVAGVFSYTVTLTGGCGTITATGSITVTGAGPVNTVSREIEPNNTFSTATPITTNPAKMKGNVFPNADTDWFSFTATAGDKIYAAVITSFSASASTDAQLRLYASDGTTLIEFDDDDGSFGSLTSTIAGATIPSSGTYYLEVKHFSATNTLRGYDLYLKKQTGAATPEVEGNDTPATANPLPGSGWVSGTRDPALATEQDWFSITLAAGETIFISMDLDPERDNVQYNGRLGVALFGDANNQILVVDDASVGSVANPLSEAMVFTAKNAGTYYVFADAASAAVGGPTATYNISVSTFAATPGYVNYPSVDIPKTIGPGAASVTSTISIPDSKLISDISIRVDLNHTVMGQIDAVLTTPNGNTIHLFSDIGAAAIGGQTLMDAVFNDNNAIPPLYTVLRPVGYQPELNCKLDMLKGMNTLGTWTLTLYDDIADANGGTLNNWSIDVLEFVPPSIGGLTTIVNEDFEATDGGFTHSGTADEWEYGTPTTIATTTTNPVAGFTTANSGTKCWKTDLDNTYDISSLQTLESPTYDLTTVTGPIWLSWAMKHQMESATFDSLRIYVEEIGGPAMVQTYFQWLGATTTAAVGSPAVNIGLAAGWGTHWVDISAFAGKQIRFKVKLGSDGSINFGGIAIDDVRIYGTPSCTPSSITLGASPAVCSGTTSANLPYTATTGTPDQYSIDYNAAAEAAGFIDIVNAALPASPIVLVVPGAAPAATYNASITVRLAAGGCVSPAVAFTVTVNATNTVTLTSAPGTNAQTVCINMAITNITYATTGATGATVTGLPAGVTGSWAANLVTISGTPTTTVGSPFNYTVTLTGGCGAVTANGTITVSANNTVTLSSAPGTDAQTVCINTAITNITYSTTGATGATVTGLPAGVTGVWAANVVTISGTPIASGPFNYTVTLTGGCGTITAIGSITVTAAPAATIAYTASPYCTIGGTATVTQTGTAGGTYSSTAGLTINAVNGDVTLATSTPGTYTVTYTVAAGGGCPLYTTTTSITINNCAVLCVENFDGVTVPALPAGWTATVGATCANTLRWVTSNTSSFSAPNAAFANDPNCISDEYLDSRTYGVAAAASQLVFRNSYNLENGFDGMVLEISINAGPFTDIITAGGSFVTGGYNGTISVNFGSPIIGRPAWTGNSGGFITTTVNLPAAAQGQNVVFRWRRATDSSVSGVGAWIDDIYTTPNPTATATISYAGSPYCSNAGIATVTQTGAAGGTYSSTAGLTLNASTGAVTLGTSTPGTYTVTYTFTAPQGCPTFTTTTTITITALPAATISYAGSPYCSNAGTATVTQTGTAGGAYTAAPAGLSLNAATGAVTLGTSTPGTYTVTYTIAAAGGCPIVTATTTITITLLPAATIVYTGSPYCSNAGTATVTRTGTAGGTYSAAPAGLTLNAANGDVTLGTSTPGTYTVTYTIAASGGCPVVTATTTITITLLPAATIVYTGSPYCSNAGTATVTRTGTAGGTYSAAPAGLTLNAVNGDVTLGTSTPGTYTVTYTIAASGGCPVVTATTTITITLLPAATINYAGSPYCTSSGTATVTRTGTAGGTYSAAPAGLTLNAANGDVTLGTSTPGTYTVTYTIAAGGGCPAVTATTSITVTAANAATISYAGTPYCTTVTNAPVTRTGTAGGTYTAAPAGLTINAATGTVNPSTSTPGTYTVTYTMAAGGGCPAATATTTITITLAPNMIIFYAGTPYCSNAGTATVSQFGTTGGTYSAAPAGLTINAATGAVTLGTSTPGTYTVTYSVTAPGCGITNTFTTITITAAPNATISYGGSPYCQNAGTANVTLTGTAGGTYSSTAGLTLNAATGAVTLGTSTPGTYTVTYSIVASGGCAAFSTTTSITITALPAATIAYTGSPYCSNAGTATVTRTGTAGGTYTAAPAGLSINAATGDVNLAASTAGTYTVTYTIAAGGGCPAVTATASITITAIPAATISYAGNPFCQPGGIASVTRTGTAGGTYSAAPAGLSINAATGDINVTTSATGTYTVTYALAAGGGCPVVNATTSVTVNSLSVAATAANATSTSLCTPGTVTLSVVGGTLGSGASWRWYSGSCGGTLVGTGATLIVTVNTTTTYFVRAEGPCNTTTCASVTVAVNVQPTISIATSRTTLLPGQTATLTATVTPAAGNTFIWYRNGVVVPGASASTLVVDIDGLGTYTARVTTAAGCTALSNAVTIIAEISSFVFVYPNPNTGQFQVRVYNPLGKQLTVIVYKSNTQLVFNKAMVTSSPYTRMDVDLRNVAGGEYNVVVVDGDNIIIGSRKILIAR